MQVILSFSCGVHSPSAPTARPEGITANVPVNPDVSTSSKSFLILYTFQRLAITPVVASAPTCPVLLALTPLVYFSPFRRGLTTPHSPVLDFQFQRGRNHPQGPVPHFPVARFTDSSPKAFLSDSSDVLAIITRSCRLVPGFLMPLLCSGHFQHLFPNIRHYWLLATSSFFFCPLRLCPLRRATSAQQIIFLPAAANSFHVPQLL